VRTAALAPEKPLGRLANGHHGNQAIVGRAAGPHRNISHGFAPGEARGEPANDVDETR